MLRRLSRLSTSARVLLGVGVGAVVAGACDAAGVPYLLSTLLGVAAGIAAVVAIPAGEDADGTS